MGACFKSGCSDWTWVKGRESEWSTEKWKLDIFSLELEIQDNSQTSLNLEVCETSQTSLHQAQLVSVYCIMQSSTPVCCIVVLCYCCIWLVPIHASETVGGGSSSNQVTMRVLRCGDSYFRTLAYCSHWLSNNIYSLLEWDSIHAIACVWLIPDEDTGLGIRE